MRMIAGMSLLFLGLHVAPALADGLPSGAYTISAEHSGFCLRTGSHAAGAGSQPAVQQYPGDCDFSMVPQLRVYGDSYTIEFGGSCATVARGVVFGPAAIDLWPCAGATDQHFRLRDAGGGSFEILTPNGNCWDVQNQSRDRASVVQFACNGQANQHFRLTRQPDRTFVFETHPPAWTVTDLGGDIRDEPSCVSWGASRIDCFARGADDTLKHISSSGGAWSGWESLGGQLREGPVCVSGRANKIDCFVRGMDSALWRQSWDGSRWQGWISAGGILTGPPSCVAWGYDTDCVSTTKGGSVQLFTWPSTGPGLWQNLGGQIQGDPSCVSARLGEIECFVRGTDNAIWVDFLKSGRWSGWSRVGGSIVAGPKCSAVGPAQAICWAYGTDFHSHLLLWNDGHAFPGSGEGDYMPDPSTACLRRPGDHILCVAAGYASSSFEHTLAQKLWPWSDLLHQFGSEAPSVWQQLPGRYAGGPSCISGPGDDAHCFVRMQGNSLGHLYLRAGN